MTHPNRDEQHGGMEAVGTITQQIKAIIRTGRNWHQLTPGEQEALDMAAHKTARILSGANPHDPEHWRDLAGYAVAARRGDSPECAPPEPSQWRNDRPPTSEDVGPSGMIWVWNSGKLVSVDYQLGAFWYSSSPANNYWSPGNQPAPTSPPPQPQPAPTGWITDRVPEEGDGFVWVPERYGAPTHKALVSWDVVYPGTPWAPASLIEPGPWEPTDPDPTTLDRNGWIRSRLPTEGDASKDRGKWVLVPQGSDRSSCQSYTIIVPGQPWAPCGSDPGPYQP